MIAKAYLVRTIQFLLLTFVLVVGLNFLIDPYRITTVARIPGLNEYKIDINDHVRLMKKYNPLRTQHNALIVGNSRVEIGMNPVSHCFKKSGMEIYNLGIPGASVRTQLAYAMNVIHQQPIETVFLSLDFTDFIFTRKHARFDELTFSEYTENGLKFTTSGEENPEYISTLMQDYYQALFSLDSLISSLQTLVLQDRAAPDRDDAGFNPARDFAEALRIEGPRALFDQKMTDLKDHFSVEWFLRDADGRMDPAFDDLREFLDMMVNRNIRVYLFINPFHEVYWELLRERGQMSLNMEWLSEVEKLVESYPENVVTLWNFSVDSPFIYEKVPGPDARSGPLQWFWEPSHYREQLGDLMIETMLSETCGTGTVFGRRIQ